MLRGLRRRLDRLWVAYQREKAMRDSGARACGRGSSRRSALASPDAGIDPASVPAMRL